MPDEKPAQIRAIELTKTVFEYVHGNLGVLKFNIEELTPMNGAGDEESKKWKVVCSFFETVGSSSPSRYEVIANLNDNTVTVKKLGTQTPPEKYTVTKDGES